MAAPAPTQRSLLLRSFLKMRGQKDEMSAKVVNSEAQKQNLMDMVMESSELPDTLRPLMNQWKELDKQHNERLIEMARYESVCKNFIFLLTQLEELVVETTEGADWLVKLRDKYWRGTAVIPLSLPDALRHDIAAKCTAALIPFIDKELNMAIA